MAAHEIGNKVAGQRESLACRRVRILSRESGRIRIARCDRKIVVDSPERIAQLRHRRIVCRIMRRLSAWIESRSPRSRADRGLPTEVTREISGDRKVADNPAGGFRARFRLEGQMHVVKAKENWLRQRQ